MEFFSVCFVCSFRLADVNRKCWYMSTKGMHAVGQSEVVILLQCLPDEKTVPKDIFTHFVQLYQEALSGKKQPEDFVYSAFPYIPFCMTCISCKEESFTLNLRALSHQSGLSCFDLSWDSPLHLAG